jgi:hypothetical protein
MSVKNIQQLVAWSAIQYLKNRDEHVRELEQFKSDNSCAMCEKSLIGSSWHQCMICQAKCHRECMSLVQLDPLTYAPPYSFCHPCRLDLPTECSICQIPIGWHVEKYFYIVKYFDIVSSSQSLSCICFDCNEIICVKCGDDEKHKYHNFHRRP